jgi:predicted nucleic acid-binding protein
VIVVDTGPIAALINNRDNQHGACTELLAHHPGPLLVPAPVFTEVCMLLERRCGTRAELAFLRDVGRGIFTLVELTESDLDRISELVETYSNLPLGTVEASVVAIAERLRVPTVATLDRRHFTIVKPRKIGAFTLLP